MIPRKEFERKVKKVITNGDEELLLQKGKAQTTNINNFSWPSTEANESKNVTVKDPGFNEESDLIKYGYKITGLSREERWKILTSRVLKELPLEKVVKTIAAHIRLRKRQKNGMNKYKHAITEWEYDLRRLKQEYYKYNFQWPES